MATATRSSLGGGMGIETAAVIGTSGAALVGHIVLVMLLLMVSAMPQCQSTTVEPEEVIQVSLISMPQSDSGMVQMDVQQATAAAPVVEEAPTPQDDPGLADDGVVEPEQVANPSDLAFQDKNTEEAKGDPDQARNEQARKDATRRLKREAMVAALGSQDSSMGDPDSTNDELINLGGSGGRTDPELAAYINKIKQVFFLQFHPLPSVTAANPDIFCQLNIRWDPNTGKVQSSSWVKRSGNPSFDGSCMRAVEAVSQLPLPSESLKTHRAIIGGSLSLKLETIN